MKHPLLQPPPQHQDKTYSFELCGDSPHGKITVFWEEILRTLESNSPVDVKEPKRSDDYTEVTYDKEQCLNTLLIGDEVISTILARETDEFIKSSVDDLVLILRESEVTSDSEI
ncbi:hypothetical protein Tco_1133344 [Tanacetum coccineum]